MLKHNWSAAAFTFNLGCCDNWVVLNRWTAVQAKTSDPEMHPWVLCGIKWVRQSGRFLREKSSTNHQWFHFSSKLGQLCTPLTYQSSNPKMANYTAAQGLFLLLLFRFTNPGLAQWQQRPVCAVGSHLLQSMDPSDKKRQVTERHDCIYLRSLRDPAQGLHMIGRLTGRKENNSSPLTSLDT